MMAFALSPSLCLMAASGDPLAAAEADRSATCHPTRLDYVVLASLADSPNWMSLSAYPGRAYPGRAGSGRGAGGDEGELR